MEKLFVESYTLQKNHNPLTEDYIKNNKLLLFDDDELKIINILAPEIKKLINMDTYTIKKYSELLNITHKYDIKKYYKILIEHVANRIIHIDDKYITLCTNVCEDIVTDIININNKYTNAIKYLLNKNDTTCNININDFLHNRKLFDYIEPKTQFQFCL